jgi:hypothetical protein
MEPERIPPAHWTVVIVVIVLAGAAAVRAASLRWSDVRGLYVYTLSDAITKAPGLQAGDAMDVTQALAAPGIDGLALVEDWSAIEPARGVFQWDGIPARTSLFDKWLMEAIGRGLKINLIVRAGQSTPCRLFNASDGLCDKSYTGAYAGARAWSFQASSHQGKGACETVEVAAPWDPAFLIEWDRMLAAVAQHLRAIGAYDSVQLVRLTGFNRTTDELRLPEEVLSAQNCQTNSISTWLRAGYRPSLLLVAWDSLIASFERNFPGRLFSVSIIPVDSGAGQYPFPEIDEAGCVYTSIVPTTMWSVGDAIPPDTCKDNVDRATADSRLNALLFSLLAVADVRLVGRLAVEFENLTSGVPANATVVEASDLLGTKLAFQTNNFLAAAHEGAGAECGPLGSDVFCTPQPYLDLLNEGVYPCQDLSKDLFCKSNAVRATFIEVFAPDVLTYSSNAGETPDAIGTAHLELVAPGP